jgi:drug/metabolite transporter (DMT)-like permease
MRHIMPGVVAMIMTTEVALAMMWSVIFLDETVTGIKIVGAAVVIAGVLLAQWVNVREARIDPQADDAFQTSPAV